MKYQLTLTTTNKNRWHILFNAVNSIQYKAQHFNTIHMIYTNNQRIYTKNVGSNTKTKCNAFNVRSHKKKKARADVNIERRGGISV